MLGDTIEHATLAVRLTDGRRLSATWPAPLVFEDTVPRLADLDFDGAPEVIVVEAHESQGARLAVWGLREGRLEQLAATPFIGTRFRRLAPARATSTATGWPGSPGSTGRIRRRPCASGAICRTPGASNRSPI